MSADYFAFSMDGHFFLRKNMVVTNTLKRVCIVKFVTLLEIIPDRRLT